MPKLRLGSSALVGGPLRCIPPSALEGRVTLVWGLVFVSSAC